MFNVYIIGAGQIGSRHLQALKIVKFPLSITVIDPSPESLKITKERYASVPAGKFVHNVDYLIKIPQKSAPIDLAIVATRSDVRSKIIIELRKSAKVKYLVLEKILFNKKPDYDFIKNLLQKSGTVTLVNCPIRMTPIYQKVEQHFRGKRISYVVSGSKFGLITNAIHYLDHAAYLSGTTEFEINTV